MSQFSEYLSFLIIYLPSFRLDNSDDLDFIKSKVFALTEVVSCKLGKEM